jgi:hypothetical protein
MEMNDHLHAPVSLPREKSPQNPLNNMLYYYRREFKMEYPSCSVFYVICVLSQMQLGTPAPFCFLTAHRVKIIVGDVCSTEWGYFPPYPCLFITLKLMFILLQETSVETSALSITYLDINVKNFISVDDLLLGFGAV